MTPASDMGRAEWAGRSTYSFVLFILHVCTLWPRRLTLFVLTHWDRATAWGALKVEILWVPSLVQYLK